MDGGRTEKEHFNKTADKNEVTVSVKTIRLCEHAQLYHEGG